MASLWIRKQKLQLLDNIHATKGHFTLSFDTTRGNFFFSLLLANDFATAPIIRFRVGKSVFTCEFRKRFHSSHLLTYFVPFWVRWRDTGGRQGPPLEEWPVHHRALYGDLWDWYFAQGSLGSDLQLF